MFIDIEAIEREPMRDEKQDLIKEARELLAKATPEPWFWNISLKSRQAHLESQARGGMLETVMDFTRWGAGGAAPRFRNAADIMERVDALTVTVEGREHHAAWYQTIDHPDAKLIARAPSLLSSMADEIEQLRKRVRELDDEVAKTSWQVED